MIGREVSPPDPLEAGTVAEFVRSLTVLRRWAGEPSLSKLRLLGGQTVTPEGATVDALPKSTTSHVLRQPGKLPRWDFVRAFVTACLLYCDYPADRIPDELERWRRTREALARPVERTAPSSSTPHPTDPAGPATQKPAVPGAAQDPVVPEAAQEPAGPGGARERAVSGTAQESAARPAGDRTAPDRAIELLARRVAREEDRARKGLLGGYRVAPLSYGPHSYPSDDPGKDGQGGDGSLHSIGRYFHDLCPRRLLIVGEPGAGKSVLAIELVLQLVEPFVNPGLRREAHPLIPVRLNAARWTPGSPFETWLARQLVHDFGLTLGDAARLVRDRRVLPVLDGLDELDPEPATDPPRRAIGLLTELNLYSHLSGRGPGAVVVTCRADRYTQLTEARAGLDDATLIYLHDLTTEQISTYLNGRWPGHHPCAADRDVIRETLSGAAGAAVYSALARPWRLLLIATAVESGADPADLLRHDPKADPEEEAAHIARRLLDAYVPAAARLTVRDGDGGRYRPEQVRTWLVNLAAHLQWQADHAAGVRRPPPGLTAVDIVPHLIWPVGGRRRVRALHGLCCLILAVVAMAAFWVGSAVDRLADLRDGLDATESLTMALMGSWVSIAVALSLRPWPTAGGGRANVPVRRRLTGGLLGALAGGSVGPLGGLAELVLSGGEVFGPVFATVAGGAGGAVLGGVIGVTAAGRRRGERMPISEAIRSEPVILLGFGLCGALTGLPPLRLAGSGPMPLAFEVIGAFALAFALGVGFKVAAGGWSKDAEIAHPREALHRDPAIGVAYGLTGGVAAMGIFSMNQGLIVSLACAVVGGVTFGLAFGAIAWSRSTLGLIVAAGRGLLPLRLWTFLDWACEARLLRVSGATYQFRHRELQDFLTPRTESGADDQDRGHRRHRGHRGTPLR